MDPKQYYFVKDCCRDQCCANSGGDSEGCILLLYTNWRKRLHIRQDHEAVLLIAGPREPAVNSSILSKAKPCDFVKDFCGVIVVQL